MKFSIGLAAATIAAVTLGSSPIFAGTVSHDYYGLRTVLNYSAGVIDSKSENDKTSDSQQYNNAPTSIQGRISLAEGSLRAFNSTSGGGQPALSNTQFGDTVTFNGGAGTSAEFTLDVDGMIRADAFTAGLNSYQAYALTARFALFSASSGATIDTWYDMSFGTGTHTALDTDIFALSEVNNISDVNLAVEETLFVSTTLASNAEALRFFGQLDVVAIRNSNPGTTELDFMNTAQLGINTDPGVTFTSASGVLLMAPVPLPASGVLLAGTFAAFAAMRRRKRAA